MLDRFKKLFEKGDDSSSLSILSKPESSAESSGEKLKSVLRASPAAEELQRRIQLTLQSETPEWLFLIGKKVDQSIAFQSVLYQPNKRALLLFTSLHGANDYVRHTRLDGQAVGMKAADIQRNAPNWASGGFSGLTLNRCPRCDFFNTVGIATLFNPQGLHSLCALNLALQRWRAEVIVKGTMPQMGTPEARKPLEFLRDHVDCANPYVHQLIAVKARIEKDEKAVQYSLQRLAEFGSTFALPTLNPSTDGRSLDPKFLEIAGKAMIGLLASYGILKIPEAQAGQT